MQPPHCTRAFPVSALTRKSVFPRVSVSLYHWEHLATYWQHFVINAEEPRERMACNQHVMHFYLNVANIPKVVVSYGGCTGRGLFQTRWSTRVHFLCGMERDGGFTWHSCCAMEATTYFPRRCTSHHRSPPRIQHADRLKGVMFYAITNIVYGENTTPV